MTTLLTWKAADNNGITSIYIASDSRISWNNGSAWNYSQKIFHSINFPEMIGYCGDTLFTTQIISKIIHLIDKQIIFSNLENSDTKHRIIYNYIKDSFLTYPESKTSFTVLYILKDKNKFFQYYEISWDTKNGWKGDKKELSRKSEVIQVYGSGKDSFDDFYTKYNQSDIADTSRSVFTCFCDALSAQKDKYSGGAPQLVGLYKGKNNTIPFGIIKDNERFIYGSKVEYSDTLKGIEWRNELFERCDPNTLGILENAQRQPKPKGIT